MLLRANDYAAVGRVVTFLKPHGEFFRDDRGSYGIRDWERFHVLRDGKWETIEWAAAKFNFQKMLQFVAVIDGKEVLFEAPPKRIAELIHKMFAIPSKSETLFSLINNSSVYVKQDRNQYHEDRFFYDIIDPLTGEKARHGSYLTPLEKPALESLSELQWLIV